MDGRHDDAVRPRFVLHEHHRPRHHFDLRLEEDGVLRSWAVPRGLPRAPGERRLAVAVPDHDLAHAGYEDATKSIADAGWWQEDSRDERRRVFTLHGHGPAVRYALVHTGGADGQEWLLLRTNDQPG